MAKPTVDSSGRIQKPAQQAPQNGSATAHQAPGKSPADTLIQLIQSPGVFESIRVALPQHVTADRMARVIATAVRTTPGLATCAVPSFLGCVLQASQLGLEVNTPLGHAWLIPRKTRRGQEYVQECTLLIGYQGEIDLALRSGRVKTIQAHVVRHGDHFEWELGLTPRLVHRPSELADREDRPITHAYAVARLDGDQALFDVLSYLQIEKRRLRSSSDTTGKYSPWQSDLEPMCKKSAVRALYPYLPKSAEMARAHVFESADERGESLAKALDPEISAALERAGLSLAEPIETQAEAPPAEASAAAQGPDAARDTTQPQAEAAGPQDGAERAS